MVAVDVAIGRRLPVAALGCEPVTVAEELVELHDLERRSHLAEPLVDVDRLARREHGEHRTRPFGRRQLDETGDVDALERLARGVPDERAVRVVDPEVVRAREAPGVPEALVRDLGTAMAAHVQEGASHPVVASRDEDRTAGDGERCEVTWLGDVDREGNQERAPTEDGVHLALKANRVGVRRNGHTEDGVAEVATVAVDVGEQPLGHGDQRRSSHPRTSPAVGTNYRGCAESSRAAARSPRPEPRATRPRPGRWPRAVDTARARTWPRCRPVG